jgi:hypothetical protein
MSAKNPGPLLFTEIRGSGDLFPDEFVAKLGKDIYVQHNPVDVDPSKITDMLIESRCVQERSNERKKIDTYFGGGGPNGDDGTTIDDIIGTTLVSRVLLRDGQIGIRTRSLQPEGTIFPADALTDQADQRNLGNGWLDQVVVTKPLVFAGTSSATEIADIIPQEFRAVFPTYTHATTLSGVITDPPVLALGEISRKEDQLDVFTFRRTKSYRDTTGIPVTVTGNKKTNRYKQVETITRILELDTTVPAVPTALRDVSFTKIGGGLAIEEHVDVPVVFANEVASTGLRDIIPPEFRANAATYTYEATLPGIRTLPPVLGAGEIQRREEQLTDFTFRRAVEIFAASLPQTLIDRELTDQFGGTILKIVKTLATAGSGTVDSGLMVVASEIRKLSPTVELKITKSADTDTSWPTLTSFKFDAEFQANIQEDRQVVVPGYVLQNGTYFAETKIAIDKWRSQRIRLTKTPTATSSATALKAYEHRPYQFPGLAPTANRADVRRAISMLTRHTMRTWWQSSPTIPAIATDDIITDTLILVSLSGTGIEQENNLIHDQGFFGGGYWFAATTPTYSQYVGWKLIFGTGSMTLSAGSTTVNGTGTAFLTELQVGDALGRYWGSGTPITIANINSNTQLVLNVAPGISGSTAVLFSRDLGSRWVGTEKIINAKATPTDIPELWKIETVSVVMR